MRRFNSSSLNPLTFNTTRLAHLIRFKTPVQVRSFLSVGAEPVLRFRLKITNLRQFSEFYAPMPNQPKQDPATVVYQIVVHGTAQELKELLQSGLVNPNIRNEDLKTPLMFAAENGRTDMMGILIESGASLNLQDVYGDTAVMHAAREKHQAAVKLLTDAGAQLDIQNCEEMTASDVTMSEDIDAHIRNTRDPGQTDSSFKI